MYAIKVRNVIQAKADTVIDDTVVYTLHIVAECKLLQLMGMTTCLIYYLFAPLISFLIPYTLGLLL